MEYRKLGKSNIKVSCLCLGSMTWGKQNTKDQAHEQLNYAFDHGINFIDTAEMYPIPPEKNSCGITETYIGSWDKLHTNRDKIILASKVSGPGMMAPRLSLRSPFPFERNNLFAALEDSLSRLKTDYIDLYQLHWPERTTNLFGKRNFEWVENEEFTPLEEVLDTLSEAVKQGKIRSVGLSNETAWGAMKFLQLADANRPSMASIQNPYSLLNRLFEIGLSEVAMREHCGLLAYSPLGFGVLSGKYLDSSAAPNSRLNLYPNYSRYNKPNAQKATSSYVKLAKKYGLSPVQMALQFVTTRDFVTSNIIGATTLEQLKENINSVQVKFPSELLAKINHIHEQNPNPAP